MIHLDFYRLFPEIKHIGVVQEQDVDCALTSYAIFVLETRLYQLIYQMFPGIEIILKSEFNKEKNRMDMYLQLRKLENTEDPFIINKQIEITNEQRKIIMDKIYEIRSVHPDYALIDIHELYNSINMGTTISKGSKYPLHRSKIPFSYFVKMLQYTGIDSSYNPFIRPEGIYLSFYPYSDYKPAYYEVCEFLVSRIYEFYNKGAVILGNEINMATKEKLIKDWKLIPLDEEEIVKTFYEPNWIDYRFARNKVDFLTRRIEGDLFIRIHVSDNLVKRHGIAMALQKENKPIIFEGSYLKVQVENLEEAQKIASVIDSSAITFGRVLVIAISTIAELYLYFEYANKKYGKGRSISYSVNNNENPYIFSMMLSDTNFSSFDELRLEFRNYAVEQLTEVTKIAKFKNSSPYKLIEEEFDKFDNK